MKIGPRNKEVSPVCVGVFVQMPPVANLCLASLSSTTVTFSLSLYHQLLFIPLKTKCTHTHILIRYHWIWEYVWSQYVAVSTPGLCFYLFLPLILFVPCSSVEPCLETGAYLHLYGKMNCIDKQQENLYFQQIFQLLTQFWSILQRQASPSTAVIAALFLCLWSE